MDELARSFKTFIVRDVIYILGGASILLAFLHLANRLPPKELPVVYYLLGAGISYVVGYIFQDGASLIGIAKTTPVLKPGYYAQKLYKRFTEIAWEEIPSNADYMVAQESLRNCASERTFGAYQRIITLMMIGTTIGSCWLAAGLLFVVRFCHRGYVRFDLVVGVALVLAGGVLLVLSWVKVLQLTNFLMCYGKIREKADKPSGLGEPA